MWESWTRKREVNLSNRFGGCSFWNQYACPVSQYFLKFWQAFFEQDFVCSIRSMIGMAITFNIRLLVLNTCWLLDQNLSVYFVCCHLFVLCSLELPFTFVVLVKVANVVANWCLSVPSWSNCSSLSNLRSGWLSFFHEGLWLYSANKKLNNV